MDGMKNTVLITGAALLALLVGGVALLSPSTGPAGATVGNIINRPDGPSHVVGHYGRSDAVPSVDEPSFSSRAAPGTEHPRSTPVASDIGRSDDLDRHRKTAIGGKAAPGSDWSAVSSAAGTSGSLPVIVTLRSELVAPERGLRPDAPPSLANDVAERAKRVLSAISSEEFQLVHQYSFVPALLGNATWQGIAALAAHPDVLHVALNREVRADLAESVPLINADSAQSVLGVTGEGVVVAVLDTGIDTDHPLLSDDLNHQKCFLEGGGCPGGGTTGPSAEDGAGHGTHVSGIITSSGPPVGVAPDALIDAFKVLDDTGSGTFGNVLSAYDEIIASHPEVDVINMSLGDGGSYSPGTCEGILPALTTAVATTRAMGITTFAASGNNASKSGIGFPACVNDVVSVGAVYDADVGSQVWWPYCIDATTAADQVVCFSQSDASLDLLAPGSPVESTFLGGGLEVHSGTSMASPMAAAAAALLLDSEPALTPAEVEERLVSTGVPVMDGGNGVTTCRVDAYEAVIDDGGPICESAAPPPPENDDFADALVVPEPPPYTNTQFTTGATTETGEPSPCGGIASTVWYRFTLASDQALVVDTFGSAYDTVLAVHTGPSVDSLTPVTCNDDFASLQSRVVVLATAGVTYHIQVGGYQGAAGSLTLNVDTAPPPPANDDFEDALVVPEPLPYTNTQFTTDSTTEAGEPSPCGGIASTVWYRFTPASDQAIVIDTFGSAYDTVLAVHTGPSVDSLTPVACNDNFGGLQSRVRIVAQAGTTYHVQVGGYYGATGNLTLNVDVAPPPPENDDFADALVVAEPLPYTNTQFTTDSTTEAGEASPCGSIASTVWYRFTAASDQALVIDTFGSEYDTVLAVHTGPSVDSLTPVACNDDYYPGLQSQVDVLATAGVTYHIQVGGYLGAVGSLTLNVDVAPPPADTDGDGCPDADENGPDETLGGRRDYLNPWDYFNPTNDGKNRIDDILAVVQHYYLRPGDPGYHPKYDRSYLGPNPWNLGAPDGQVLVQEVLWSLQQYHHDCGTGVIKGTPTVSVTPPLAPTPTPT